MSRQGILERDPGRHGFTLVELLVVIVIIGILIGFLVPAVGAVRRAAREAGSKAVLTALEQGLESFKADAKLGGAYPPSFSDATSNGWGHGKVVTPFLPNNNNTTIDISGAGLLVWALSGADLLGTPGFIPFDRDLAEWSNSSGTFYDGGDPTQSGAYALYPQGHAMANQPVHPRSGPYVDGSKVTITRNEGTPGQIDFVIPEERKIVGSGGIKRQYPLYLDTFGYPVLYWRADPAGRVMAAKERTTSPQRGIYYWEDNARLTGDPLNPADVLVLNKGRQPHVLVWDGGSYTTSNPPPLGTFERYIMNGAVQARLEPSRPDSFLLVSPGFDGRYGTADDIANFAHNGQ